MSEEKFTEGNLIMLYANQRTKDSEAQHLPIHIHERVKTCLNTIKLIKSSKPDKNDTRVVIISTLDVGKLARDVLIQEGVDQDTIRIDSGPKNISEIFDLAIRMIKPRANPPHMYFICPFWLRDIYDSLVESKLKGYRVQFDGAPDDRSIEVVEQEKILETPRKNSKYYKKRAKSKAVDMLLNYIFREKQ
jgi:hypothetical protein